MELVCCGFSFSVDPESFVESDRVDNQRITFPAADGVSVVTRHEVFWMLAAIHVNRSKRVGSADIEDVHPFLLGNIEELHTIRGDELSRSSGRFAARVRFIAFERRFAESV